MNDNDNVSRRIFYMTEENVITDLMCNSITLCHNRYYYFLKYNKSDITIRLSEVLKSLAFIGELNKKSNE